MARIVLVTGSPLDVATRSPTYVGLAGGGARAYTYDDRDDWLAGVVADPRFTAALGFDGTGWTGGAIPTTGAIVWAPSDSAVLSRIAGLYWVDQRVTVRVGDDTAADPAPAVRLVGKIAAQAVADGRLTLTIADLSGDLAKTIIPATARFAGTGGIEGDLSIAGRVKRRSWGRVFNVEGRVLIAADNVYEFGDPARPLHSMPTLRDKGRDAPADSVSVIAWAGSIDATLAALRAAVPVRGGGVVAPSIAAAKWWTQPSGPFTADLHGEGGADYADTPAGIAALIVAGASTLVVADLDAAIALRPAPAGIHADDESETAASLLDRLLLGASLLWSVDPVGTVRIRAWAWPARAVRYLAEAGAVASAWATTPAVALAWAPVAASAATLRSAGAITRKQVLRPITTRRIGYQRNYRVHTAAEISAALLADDVRYANGASVAALQPAEGGADVTASNQHSMSQPQPVVVAADYLGNVVAGQLPVQRSFRRLLGDADVSPGAAWSLTAPEGVTATIDDVGGDLERGTVTLSAITVASATLVVRSSYAGLDLFGQLSVTRGDASTMPSSSTSPGGDGSTAGNAATVAADGAPGASGDFVAITPEMAVTIGAGGKVTLAFQLSYTAIRGGEDDDGTVMAARVTQFGSDWQGVAPEATGSPAFCYFRSEPPKGAVNDAGSVSFGATLTGIAAGPVRFRIEARCVEGAGVASVTGSASATPL